MIAHQQATKGKPGFNGFVQVLVPDLYYIIVILEVGAVGICAQVTPFADHCIAYKTIMAFITIGKEDNIADLSAYFRARPDGATGIYFSAHFQHCTITKRKRSADQAAFHDLGIITDIYCTATGIDDGTRLYFGRWLQENMLFGYHRYTFRYRCACPVSGNIWKIIFDGLLIH